eukprot:c7976_g1_i1 orf=84-269(-)
MFAVIFTKSNSCRVLVNIDPCLLSMFETIYPPIQQLQEAHPTKFRFILYAVIWRLDLWKNP